MPTLDWLNREEAFRTAQRVPYRLLEFVSAHTARANPETEAVIVAPEKQAKLFGRTDEKNTQFAPQVLSKQPSPLPQGEGMGEGKANAPPTQSALQVLSR
jgi:hypothetical protein